MINERTISDFLSNEYKDFATYVIEHRAIPSVIDGLKPTQRKVIHTATKIWKTGNEKPLRVFQLAASAALETFYHHGNVSIEDSTIGLAQKFKNNLPLLEEVGQFGKLRTPVAGASRYISTRLTENFNKLYKDNELLTYRTEEGNKIEPYYFLPIIPTVLLNGSMGIAVGFASNILNRNPLELTDAVIKTLEGKTYKPLSPYIPKYMGTITADKETKHRWIIKGKYIITNKTVRVVELPPSITYDSYEKYLDELIEKEKIISYDNNCKENVDYTIKLSEVLTEGQIIKLLKLEGYETENFTTLDEFGKMKVFDSVESIIKYFVAVRLKYYDKRKQYIIDKLERELLIINNRIKFIKSILENKLKINNRKKDDIIKDLVKMKFDYVDGNYDYLLRMQIHYLTKEMYDKLISEESDKKKEISEIKKKTAKELYMTDLTILKADIKKTFTI